MHEQHFHLGCDLLRACCTGDGAKVAQIIKTEARMSTFKDYDGRTALHVAASEGRLALVEYLVAAGAQVNVSDRWGGSPLDDAMRHRHDDVQTLLRSSGGRLGVSCDGEALIVAANRGETAEIEALSLSSGTNGVLSAPTSPSTAPLSPRIIAEASETPTPRGLRLNVRDNRKKAIATSSTLDFVSLSACDEEMVQECDEAHTHTEVRKRNICAAGASADVIKRQRSKMFGRSKSPALSSEDPSSDELGGFELRLIKMPKQKDPVRPQSSRGGDSRCGDSLFDDTSPGPAPPSQLVVPPLLRTLRSLHAPTGTDVHLRPPSSRPPSSLFGHCPASRAGSRPGSKFGASSGTRSSLSISGMSTGSTNLTSRPSRTSTETPPGFSNAFESHAMLVRCPAPRRPSVNTRYRPISAAELRLSSRTSFSFSHLESSLELNSRPHSPSPA